MRAPDWTPPAHEQALARPCLGRRAAAANGLTLAVARTRAGCFPMAVSAGDPPGTGRGDAVSWSIMHLGRWELDSADQYALWPGVPRGLSLPPTGTFLDIGANLGFHQGPLTVHHPHRAPPLSAHCC